MIVLEDLIIEGSSGLKAFLVGIIVKQLKQCFVIMKLPRIEACIKINVWTLL